MLPPKNAADLNGAVLPWTAGDLLGAGLCSAPCLLGQEGGACACRCGGEYHSALVEAEVRAPARWWLECGYFSLCLDAIPVFSDRDRKVYYRAAKRRGDPFYGVRRAGGNDWRVEWDADTDPSTATQGPGWLPGMYELGKGFLFALLGARRVRDAWASAYSLETAGFRSREEALTVVHLWNECWMGNDSSTRRAIAALDPGARD